MGNRDRRTLSLGSNIRSKHLKVLENAKLISRGREAQWRPCKLEAKPLQDVEVWVERFRRNWEESFSRLDDYLEEMKAIEKESKK